MRKSWTMMALVLWAGLGGGLAEGQEGAISGRVFELGGQGVVGAQVEAIGVGAPIRRMVVTGLDGRYQVPGLPVGSYRVKASKPDAERRYFTSYYRAGGASLSFRDAGLVLVLSGQSVLDVDIRMFRRPDFQGSIAGIVRRASDGAVVQTGVVQVRAAFADFQDTVELGGDGRYRMEKLPPGNYFVIAAAPGHARQVHPNGRFLEQGEVVTVPAPPLGGPLGGIDFALQPGGSIAGSVRRESNFGVRVPRAQVAALNGEGRVVAIGAADAVLGNYKLDFLPLGSYRVAAWAPRDLADNLGFEFYQDASSFALATPVVLGGDAPMAEGIDLTLPDGGVLSGTVRDGQGQPMAGALVIAQPERNPLGLDQSTFSAPDGTYRLEKLAAGRYLVQAGAPGKVREFFDEVLSRESATPVGIAAGATLSGVDFHLEAGRTLDGTVRLGTQPVNNAHVVARSDSIGFTRAVRSRQDGSYVLEGLPPVRDYRLLAQAPNAAPTQVFPVDLSAGNQRMDLRLEAGYGLGGRILSDGGGAIANAVVELSHPRIPATLSIRSDPMGQYAFKHLPSIAGYRLAAGAPGHARTAVTGISLEAGDRLNLNVLLGPGRSISGRVTRESVALGDMRVTAHSTASGGNGSARTEPDGTYTIDGLPSAPDYIVVAGRDALHAVLWPGRVDLSFASATGIDIDIPTGNSVSGTVMASGSPLSRARVMTWSASEQRGGVAITDIQGAYSIANLPEAEDYRLLAVHGSFAPQYYDRASTPGAATIVDLRGGSASGLDFDLAPGATISGVVRASSAEPVPGAFVAVVSGGSVLGTAQTDANGLFETTAVAPGTYGVVARAAGQPDRAQVLGVTVGSEPVTGLELSFAEGGAIEGSLQLGDEADPRQASVVVFRKSDESFAGLAAVTETGAYRVDGLAAGEYLVTATAEGYLSQAYQNAASLALATPVNVSAGGTAGGIDFDLPPAPAGTGAGGHIRALSGLIISSCSVAPGVWTSSSKISVNWEPVEGSVGYNVSFDTAEGSTAPADATLEAEATSTSSETLADGIYYVHVRSFGLERDPETGLPTGGVLTEETDAGPFLLDTSPPPSPDQLSASTDTGQVDLSWLNPLSDPGGSGLDAVQVQRDDTLFPGAPAEGQLVYQNGLPGAGQTEEFTDTSVLDGQQYFYTVFAIDAAGNVSIPGAQISDTSAPLGEDPDAPETPVPMGAFPSEGEMLLVWKNPSDGDLQGVEIRHSKLGYPRAGQGQLLARIGAEPREVMSYIHKQPGSGPHYYSIFAYDAVPNYSAEAAQIFGFVGGQVNALGFPALAALALLWAALRRRGTS